MSYKCSDCANPVFSQGDEICMECSLKEARHWKFIALENCKEKFFQYALPSILLYVVILLNFIMTLIFNELNITESSGNTIYTVYKYIILALTLGIGVYLYVGGFILIGKFIREVGDPEVHKTDVDVEEKFFGGYRVKSKDAGSEFSFGQIIIMVFNLVLGTVGAVIVAGLGWLIFLIAKLRLKKNQDIISCNNLERYIECMRKEFKFIPYEAKQFKESNEVDLLSLKSSVLGKYCNSAEENYYYYVAVTPNYGENQEPKLLVFWQKKDSLTSDLYWSEYFDDILQKDKKELYEAYSMPRLVDAYDYYHLVFLKKLQEIYEQNKLQAENAGSEKLLKENILANDNADLSQNEVIAIEANITDNVEIASNVSQVAISSNVNADTLENKEILSVDKAPEETVDKNIENDENTYATKVEKISATNVEINAKTNKTQADSVFIAERQRLMKKTNKIFFILSIVLTIGACACLFLLDYVDYAIIRFSVIEYAKECIVYIKYIFSQIISNETADLNDIVQLIFSVDTFVICLNFILLISLFFTFIVSFFRTLVAYKKSDEEEPYNFSAKGLVLAVLSFVLYTQLRGKALLGITLLLILHKLIYNFVVAYKFKMLCKNKEFMQKTPILTRIFSMLKIASIGIFVAIPLFMGVLNNTNSSITIFTFDFNNISKYIYDALKITIENVASFKIMSLAPQFHIIMFIINLIILVNILIKLVVTLKTNTASHYFEKSVKKGFMSTLFSWLLFITLIMLLGALLFIKFYNNFSPMLFEEALFTVQMLKSNFYYILSFLIALLFMLLRKMSLAFHKNKTIKTLIKE